MPPRELAPGEIRTLGWDVVDWIEAYLCHGPGDVQGEPLELDDEFAAFILKAYALDEQGRRLYDRAFLSRPKGRAKSELAGAIGCAEALGPVRFDGWNADGDPVGRPIRSPFIRTMATEEGQSGHTYDNIAVMLDHAACEHPELFGGIDLGRSAQTSSRILLPDGGEIVPSTASNAAKDGGKETFVVLDEPLALDTPVPTPLGWRQIGDLAIGDYVYGVDGRPVLVWGVAPVKVGRPCFRVTFDDGTSVTTDASHRWRVFDRKSTLRWGEWTTGELAAANWYGGKRFAVAQPTALENAKSDLPLDPYVLGLWLGDGDSRCSTVAVGRDDRDDVLVLLDEAGFRTQVYDYNADRGAVVIRFNHGAPYGKAGTSQHALRELGVLGNKHVPDKYLWASKCQRLALLQGLMDSDGYVNDRGNCVFTNTSQVLADAVVHLVRSLGWRATSGHWTSDTRWARATGTWRASFTPSGMVPFRLPRKRERCRVDLEERTRAIAAVEPVESVPVRCIAVDSDDHLFLVGDGMLPTHNTHLYVLPTLIRMHKTVRRNLRKRKAAEGWSLETSTMYAEGEESVAEQTHQHAELIAAGKVRRPRLLFDHREAPPVKNWDDDEEVLAALRHVYGPAAAWTDLEGILTDMRDPQSDRDDSERYWLNRPSKRGQAAFDLKLWRRLGDPDCAVPDGELIVLGFDGARYLDSTALVATDVETGFQWPLGVWERPEEADETWSVDESDVDSAIEEAFDRWQVWRAYCDPPYWETAVSRWAGRWGEKRVVEWWTNRTRQMAYALRAFAAAVKAGDLSHDGDGTVARHVGNARREMTRIRDDEGRQMWTIRKPHPRSPRKIDAAMAAVLSWQARLDATAKGARKRVRRAGGF